MDDKYVEQAASKVLADLSDKGGGTYWAGTLLPFTPTVGYAVAEGGIAIPATLVTTELAYWACKAVAGEFITSFVGTWLDEGTVYFDGVEFWTDLEYALAKGRENGQKAIYDFANQTAIEVTP